VARTTEASSGPVLSAARFRAHFGYAAPFGVATAFWAFRSQGEQWIGAAILPAREYAALSIAAVVIPLLAIVQQSLTASSVAEVNRLESQGHVRAMVRLNARSNELAAVFLFPLVVFLFVASGPLVEMVYTSAYIDAALVLKLLCVGFIGGFIEVSSLAKALRMQREVLAFDATMLVASIAVSLAGAWYWGLAGIVLGSVASRFVSTGYFLTVLSRRTGVARRKLQNWSAIGRSFGAALGAGALAWVLVEGPLHGQANLVKVVAAAACVGAMYLAATAVMGLWTRRPPLPEPTIAGGLASGLGPFTVPGALGAEISRR
jgi:O-antigen/teichoic acid export membrane protein